MTYTLIPSRVGSRGREEVCGGPLYLFFSSRRRHTRSLCDWSSDVCSSDLARTAPQDDPRRRDEWLLSAIPRDGRKVYKIRPIVECLVDEGSFLETGRHWGRAIVTGLARIDGWQIGRAHV